MVVSKNNPFVVTFTAEEFFKMKIGQQYAKCIPSFVLEDIMEEPKYIFRVDFKHQVVEMGFQEDMWQIEVQTVGQTALLSK